ncbi:MAG: hypothetical protein JO222_02915, partial [Frankiales bacterium]|nr:hypothetical protein [Frankiales bacterium]
MVDWVDYKARNEAADPAAFTKRVLSLAGGSAIYRVYRDGYPTVGDKCGEIYAGLAASRGTPQVLVHDNRHSFEEERLVRFVPR